MCAIIGGIERHWVPREPVSWGNSSSSFRRCSVMGIVASGGDGGDNTRDGVGRSEVGRGSAQGSRGDGGAMR